jgi:hypothetical protein
MPTCVVLIDWLKSGGLDVVEQGADGRLQRIAMFHGPLPAFG